MLYQSVDKIQYFIVSYCCTMEPEHESYDLVIIGAGCVGMAMAYEARKHGKTCLVVEKQKIGASDRYWSSSFSARQNRVQYTEEYLTRYVIQSNAYWNEIQAEAKTLLKDCKTFRTIEGALWFGDKLVTTSEGNIFESNAVLEKLNVERLNMESLIPTQPAFFKNFKFNEANQSKNWAALFQPDGGSINMEASYNYFKQYATTLHWKLKNKPVKIVDEAELLGYQKNETGGHTITFKKDNAEKSVSTKKIYIAAGIQTSGITQSIFDNQDMLNTEATISEYVASYFEIEAGKEGMFDPSHFPNWIQFLEEQFGMGYGFPYHEWDTIGTKKTIKIGTMEAVKMQVGQTPPKDLTVPNGDKRVLAVIDYVTRYMNFLKLQPVVNYKCPIVFYQGRETICDYLNRTEKDIVVQTGGWIGKYYPLLASSSFKLLFTPWLLQNANASQDGNHSRQYIQRTFLNRTSYPLRKRILSMLGSQKSSHEEEYDTLIIGAGVSGLYSGYRLLEHDGNQKIGIYDMGDRIAGRLWSVTFQGSSTPMQLGGMRYIEKNHELLSHYIKKLHIPSLDFQMAGNVLQNNALHAYFRNDRYKQNQWEQLQAANQKLMTAYRIQNDLIGMTAFQMISYSAYLIFTAEYNHEARSVLNDHRKDDGYFDRNVITSKLINTDWKNYTFTFKLQDWNILKPYLLFRPSENKSQENSGKSSVMYPLYKYGFQNIIENLFSHEAYNFISEQNGYFSNTSNASYLQQIMTYLIDFGDVTYKTLAGGFDMFCYNLANNLFTNPNFNKNECGLYLQHQLVNIQRNHSLLPILHHKKYKLTFNHKSACGTKFGQKVVFANKIILGMPSRAVEILYNKMDILKKNIDNYCSNPKILNLKSAKRPNNLEDLLLSTQRMPAIKIIMNFTQNWWDVGHSNKSELQPFRSVEQMRGVSVTDLPIRQCLYFGNNNQNFLLASYNDMVTAQFWKYLQLNFDPFTPAKNKKNAGRKCLKRKQGDKDVIDASVQVVREVVRQLSLLHGQQVDAAWVKQALYQNWGRDPFGAGYHNWFSGYDVQAVMKAVRRPWKDEEIFIVGEAFSNLTGWVQGALQTSEHVLVEEFNCPLTDPSFYIGY